MTRYTPGFTASGHLCPRGMFWHPGRKDGCPKCGGWVVRCSDGKQRHTQPFASRFEAARFAEWGHCCSNRHTIERT